MPRACSIRGSSGRLPFLPATIGLITGRASAAEHDVTTVSANTLARGAVRGPQHRGAGTQRRGADRRGAARTRRPSRVWTSSSIARGGGSVEDLLPFSDETLCRAISACTTPVVSAVGHEPDNPLCDLVADLRAATPTDAAKRIVPDAAAEQALVGDLRRRCARALRNWVSREERHVAQLRSRPVLADPLRMLDATVRRDPSGPHRDPSRHHPVDHDGVGPGRAPVGPAGHAGAVGHAGAGLCGRPGAVPGCCGRWPTPRRAPNCGSGVSDGAVTAVSQGESDA